METIKIEGVTVAVSDLPESIQNKVMLYEHITGKLIEARKELGTYELARLEAARQITASYNQHLNDVASKKLVETSSPSKTENTQETAPNVD